MLLVSWGVLKVKAICFTEGPRSSSQLSGSQIVTASVNLQLEYTWHKDQVYIHFRLSNKLENTENCSAASTLLMPIKNTITAPGLLQ